MFLYFRNRNNFDSCLKRAWMRIVSKTISEKNLKQLSSQFLSNIRTMKNFLINLCLVVKLSVKFI